MGFDFAAAKATSRQVVHDHLAVSALYHDADTPSTEITVRWHTKQTLTVGAMDGGYDAQFLEGIHRLIFNVDQLAEAFDGTPLELRARGVVTIPQYDNAQFSLEAKEPEDGPKNIYWTVALVTPDQVVAPPA